MARALHHCETVLVFVMMALAGMAMPSRASEPLGTFAVVSDIHFNPFAAPGIASQLARADPKDWQAIFAEVGGQEISPRGEDTNHALLASALAALSERAGKADLVIVSGDLLAHRFEGAAAQALGTSPASENVRSLAAKSALYVMSALHAALPDRPILVALGNNDSECGDYQIEPGGTFLSAMRDTVRGLAGSDRLDPHFDRTFAAGGYYAMQHPQRAQTTILVINDVLWSTRYRDACGAGGDLAAQEMMGWLEGQLAEARANSRQVWLVHHIPVGIDAYSTLHDSSRSSCTAGVVPFLKEPFASRLVMLLKEYASTIQANFSGHTHQDSYRLVSVGGTAVGVEKIVPSISPIFGNDPGFHLFDYNRRTGEPLDFSTWHLANLDQVAAGYAPAWRREYVFTAEYGQQAYSAAAVRQIVEAMSHGGAAGDRLRSMFSRLYPVGHDRIEIGAMPAHLCSFSNLDPMSFIACYCEK